MMYIGHHAVMIEGSLVTIVYFFVHHYLYRVLDNKGYLRSNITAKFRLLAHIVLEFIWI